MDTKKYVLFLVEGKNDKTEMGKGLSDNSVSLVDNNFFLEC